MELIKEILLFFMIMEIQADFTDMESGKLIKTVFTFMILTVYVMFVKIKINWYQIKKINAIRLYILIRYYLKERDAPNKPYRTKLIYDEYEKVF